MTERSKIEVGLRVKARRLELGLTPADVVNASGVDTKTYGSLEDGTRWPQERTRLKVEPTLRWAPGSIDRLLDGKEPIELPAAAEPVEESEGDQFLEAATLLWEVVTELANSPEGDPERRWKVQRVLVATADVLVDVLLRLNAGPAAKQLIKEMSGTAHNLMSGQIEPLQEEKRSDVETVAQSDASAAGRQNQEVTRLPHWGADTAPPELPQAASRGEKQSDFEDPDE